MILLAPRAAITAIQRMTSARIFTIMVPIIPFPRSRAFPAHDFPSGLRSQIVVRVISPNLKVVVEDHSEVSISTTSDFIFSSLGVLFVAHATSPRNMSPNARAADT